MFTELTYNGSEQTTMFSELTYNSSDQIVYFSELIYNSSEQTVYFSELKSAQLSIPISFGVLVPISGELVSYFKHLVNYTSTIIFSELKCICSEQTTIF